MVERHGVAYHEKELGQLFCDLSAKLIVQMLLDECQQAGVQIQVDCVVSGVERSGVGFALGTNRGPVKAKALVVASGGLSIPKMGATGFGYDLAKQFGHRVMSTRAALVPLTFSEDHLAQYRELSGIGLPVEARCDRQRFTAPMLFTHRGLSGPAILQISSYWQSGDDLQVNLLPGKDASEWLMSRQQSRPDAELSTARRIITQAAGAAVLRASLRQPAATPISRGRLGVYCRSAAALGVSPQRYGGLS